MRDEDTLSVSLSLSKLDRNNNDVEPPRVRHLRAKRNRNLSITRTFFTATDAKFFAAGMTTTTTTTTTTTEKLVWTLPTYDIQSVIELANTLVYH